MPPAGKSYAIEPPVVPAAGKSDARCSLKGERDMKLTTPAEVVPALAVTLMHGDGQQKAESGSGAKNESGASNKNNFLGALQCIAERQDNATVGINEMHEGLKMGSKVFKANMQQQILDDKGEKLFTAGKEANFSISATSRFSGHERLDDVAGTGYVLDDSELLNGDQQNIQRGGENTQKITVRKHKLKKKAKPVLTSLVLVMVIENDEVFFKEAEPAARTSSFTTHAAHAKKDDPGGDNLEISSMQPLADSDSDNLEVHPCIARRRKSESSLDHGNWNSLHASEPVEPLSTLFPSFHNDMSHVHKFYNGDGWDIVKLNSCLPMSLIDEILQLPFDRSQEDIAYWALTSNGDFSLWSAWEAELQALLRGLLLCKERNITNLWIEMDALVAVQMIQQSQKGSHDLSLPSTHGLASGQPPDPPNQPPAAPFPPPQVSTRNPPTIWPQNPNPSNVEDRVPNLQIQHQHPVSPRSAKKSFLSIVTAATSAVIPPTRATFRYKDKPAVRFYEDEIETLAKSFRFSIVEKFSRTPRLVEIRQAFVGLGLSGAYNIRWMDYKHVLIHLSNEQDFNRIWTKQTWFIAKQKMRVFKWTPDFESEKESSIVPVWISFPNLRAHLFEKSALFLIAKAIGNPLGVDEATANGTRPSVARVCIEYDCLKSPVESVWIVTSKRGSEDVTGGYLQKVDFAPMPEYCNHCCHVGHGMENCLVLGQKSGTFKPKSTEKPNGNFQGNPAVNHTMEAEVMNPEKEVGGMDVEKRKADARMAVPKHVKTWQVVQKSGSSGAKDARGIEIASQVEEEDFVQTSNRFDVMEKLQEMECEKQGKTESGNSSNAGKQLASSAPVDVDERRKTQVIEIKRNEEVMPVAARQCRSLRETKTPAQVKGSGPIEPTGESLVQNSGKDKGGELRCLHRDATEERRRGAEDQNRNDKLEGAVTAAVLSAKLQTEKDGFQMTFHDYGLHGQPQKHVEERDNHAEMERERTVNDLNNKKKSRQKPTDGVVEASLQAAETSLHGKRTQLHSGNIEGVQLTPREVQANLHGNRIQNQTRKIGGEKEISEFSAVGRTNTILSQIVHGKRSKKDGFHSEKDEEMTALADDGTLAQQTEQEGTAENSKKYFFKTQSQVVPIPHEECQRTSETETGSQAGSTTMEDQTHVSLREPTQIGHRITIRKQKLKKKAKPVLASLVLVMNVDDDRFSLDFVPPAKGQKSEKKKHHLLDKGLTDIEESGGLNNSRPESGNCVFNIENSSIPSNEAACSNPEQEIRMGTNVHPLMHFQAAIESHKLDNHPRVIRRRNSNSSLYSPDNWNSMNVSEYLEGKDGAETENSISMKTSFHTFP
ncbi:Ribonuclease H domain - like 10 [Theobroma cacao]|nr:Ribonuclease H domain - like 10 [Theobroma cacao]